MQATEVSCGSLDSARFQSWLNRLLVFGATHHSPLITHHFRPAMPLSGKRTKLRVNRIGTPGVFVDGGLLGGILVPGRYVPDGTLPGEELEVFVHRDSEDRVVATTETPYAEVGEFAYLRVISANPSLGAFLDWGLTKDLLLPVREQDHRVVMGDWVVVYIFLDERTERIVASARLNRHLNHSEPQYKEGERVDLLVMNRTELGFNAIINGAHRGLLYHNELSTPLSIGQKLDGYIRTVRPDGKIDLGLDPVGYGRVAPLTEKILDALKAAGGRLPFSDESSPEDIRGTFGSSKKAFKQAIGALFKDRKIVIEKSGIRLK